MAKDTFYFQHDYDPLSDPKLYALVGEFGAVGYGLYWRIVEMLHSDNNHYLHHKKYIYTALAKQMLTSVEQVGDILSFAIEICELFETDGEKFWSNRVIRNIEKRAEIKEKRSKAGKISAEKRKNSTSVEQVLTSVEHNSTKERKGKEIKEKESSEYTEIFDTYKKHLLSRMNLDRLCMNAPVSISQQHSEMVMNEFLQTCYGDLVMKDTKLQAEQYFINWVKKDNRVNEAINNQIRKRNARNRENTASSN